MLLKDKQDATIMGFARYERRIEATPEDVIAAALRWREEFLSEQEGVIFHAFFGNLRGGFADVIFCQDEGAFEGMLWKRKARKDFLALLEPSSMRLCKSVILKQGLRPPTDFTCVEFGTFQLAEGRNAEANDVLRASDHIEATYLRGSANTRGHFVTQIDSKTFAEVVFGKTLGETRRTCMGYTDDPNCEAFLKLADPKSLDLDFWYLLA